MTAKKRKAKAAVADQLAPFDVSRHLNSEAVIAEYLAAALEDPNPDVSTRSGKCRQGARHGFRG